MSAIIHHSSGSGQQSVKTWNGGEGTGTTVLSLVTAEENISLDYNTSGQKAYREEEVVVTELYCSSPIGTGINWASAWGGAESTKHLHLLHNLGVDLNVTKSYMHLVPWAIQQFVGCSAKSLGSSFCRSPEGYSPLLLANKVSNVFLVLSVFWVMVLVTVAAVVYWVPSVWATIGRAAVTGWMLTDTERRDGRSHIGLKSDNRLQDFHTKGSNHGNQP